MVRTKKRTRWEIIGLNPHQQLSSSAQMKQDVNILANCLSAVWGCSKPDGGGANENLVLVTGDGSWKVIWSSGFHPKWKVSVTTLTRISSLLQRENSFQRQSCHHSFPERLGTEKTCQVNHLIWRQHKTVYTRQQGLVCCTKMQCCLPAPPGELAGRRSLLPTVNQQHIWTSEPKDLNERPESFQHKPTSPNTRKNHNIIV